MAFRTKRSTGRQLPEPVPWKEPPQ